MSYTVTRGSFDHDHRRRSYTIVAPDELTPHALLLYFHGSLQSSNVARNFTGHTFDALAERGIVVVYPDGIHHHFNDARRDLGERTRQLRVDDVGFVTTLVEKLTHHYDLSPQRVYGCGFSNGGQMVYRLLLEAPGLLKGAATYAATLPAPENLLPGINTANAVPTPFLSIHGTADPIAPYTGGEAGMDGNNRGPVRSFRDTGEIFARINGHDPEGVTRTSSGSVITEDWSATDKPPVRLITVEGMGHLVPAPKKLDARLGAGTDQLIAAEATADFFDLRAG